MSEIKVDTVAEKTSANGVTVDGLNIKDSKLVTANSVVETNLTDNIVTLAKMASGTDGNIISYDASGNPVAVATGSSGQVLTSAGAGSPPTFETPSTTAAVYVKVGAVNVTSSVSEVTLSNVFSSTYRNYMVVLEGIKSSNTEEHLYYLPLNSSGSSSSEHAYAMRQYNYNNTVTTDTADNSANIKLFQHSASGSGRQLSGILNVFNPNQGQSFHSYTYHISGSKHGQGSGYNIGGGRSATNQVYTSFEIKMSSNNIIDGVVSVYGIVNPV